MDTHVILTLGRSGSNTLVDLLNQNPAILNYGEVLGEWNTIRKAQRRLRVFRGNDKAYLDALLRNKALLRAANFARTLGKAKRRKWSDVKALRNVRQVGVKDFAINFIRLDIYDYLATSPDVKVIGLERPNAIDRMISNEYLERTGVIALKDGQSRSTPEPLWIDPDRVLEKLDRIERESNELRRMLDVLPADRVFRVDYDALYSDAQTTTALLREMYGFLGVPDHVPTVRMRKILKGDPLHALQNGDALRRIISRSPFAVYLYDAPKPAAEHATARDTVERVHALKALVGV